MVYILDRRSVRRHNPAMRLGIDSFSFHLRFGRHGYPSPEPATAEWLLDTAAALGVDGVQLDPSHHAASEEQARQLGAYAAARGLFLEWGLGGFDPPRVTQALHQARVAGARVLRTFIAGERPDAARLREWSSLAVQWFGEVMPLAQDLGVSIALENHGDLLAHELREIIEGVGHPCFGACVDVGNNVALGEDALRCTSILAPFAKSVHLKDGRLRNGTIEYTALGEGDLPLREICSVLERAAPDVALMVEVPSRPRGSATETLAAEFAAVQRSVRYAQRVLGLGR